MSESHRKRAERVEQNAWRDSLFSSVLTRDAGFLRVYNLFDWLKENSSAIDNPVPMTSIFFYYEYFYFKKVDIMLKTSENCDE